MQAGNCVAWGQYQLIRISNSNNVMIDIATLGATIVNFYVTDKRGCERNIVLGYDDAEGYVCGDKYIGAVVGPWANRIEKGQYKIEGEQPCQLEQNEKANHLHGGSAGVHTKAWQVKCVAQQGVTLTTRVEAGEAGYPYSIAIEVTYRLSESNELSIQYQAFCEGIVPINLTQHSYFNLNGDRSDITDHCLSLEADEVLIVDACGIPTASVLVDKNIMDLRTPVRLDHVLDQHAPSLSKLDGYDHCFVIKGQGLRTAAWLFSSATGIELEMLTDQAGVQFYTGTHLGSTLGRHHQVYSKYSGLCLEAQHFPNQPNMADKQLECLYGPERMYKQTTVYRVNVL